MRFREKLFNAIGDLKRLVRTGWREHGVPDPESVAAHSFGVALLTLLLAEEREDRGEPIDVRAAVRMALLHDLPEHATGDLSPRQRRALFGSDGGDDEASGRAAQREAERRAFERLLEDSPEALRVRWCADWRRYRDGEGEEAQLVQLTDKLDCVLQALRYRREAGARSLDEFHHLLAEIDDSELREALRRSWQRKRGGG